MDRFTFQFHVAQHIENFSIHETIFVSRYVYHRSIVPGIIDALSCSLDIVFHIGLESCAIIV